MAPLEKKQNSNLAKKILAVVAEIGVLKKDKKNDFHNYQYASDEMIVGAIRDAVIKHGLAIFPSQTECSEIMTKTTKGADQIITKLRMEFELVDVDSQESKVVSFYGYGSDTGDKGIYKASTGCEKYFLMKTFLIATPDDPEFDKTQKAAKESYAQRSAPTPRAPTATPAAEKPLAHPGDKAEPAPAAATPAVAAPNSKAPSKIVTTTIEGITKVTPKNGGQQYYRITDDEGATCATWSDTVAKDVSDFAKRRVRVAMSVRLESKGAVLEWARPA